MLEYMGWPIYLFNSRIKSPPINAREISGFEEDLNRLKWWTLSTPIAKLIKETGVPPPRARSPCRAGRGRRRGEATRRAERAKRRDAVR